MQGLSVIKLTVTGSGKAGCGKTSITSTGWAMVTVAWPSCVVDAWVKLVVHVPEARRPPLPAFTPAALLACSNDQGTAGTSSGADGG